MKQNPSGIATLITDFGRADAYVGAMKGAILRVNPRCLVTDITHEIDPQNILRASFVLIHSFPYYPAVVDPGVGTKRRALALEKDGHLFVGPDR